MNALGLRGPEIQASKASGTVRVATVGASETFGLYESPDQEWPRQLETRLRRGHPNVEVLNASIAGMGLRRRLEFFQNRIVDLEPDVVLLMLEYSGYVGVVLAAARDSSRRVVEPSRASRDISLSPRVIKRTVDAVVPRLPTPVQNTYRDLLVRFRIARLRAELRGKFARFREVGDAEIREYEKDLTAFLELTKELGITPVILVPALLVTDASLRDFHSNFPQLANSWVLEALELFPSIARRIASEYGATVIDLSAALAGRKKELMMDMFHFNDEGATVVADVIANEIDLLVTATR